MLKRRVHVREKRVAGVPGAQVITVIRPFWKWEIFDQSCRVRRLRALVLLVRRESLCEMRQSWIQIWNSFGTLVFLMKPRVRSAQAFAQAGEGA